MSRRSKITTLVKASQRVVKNLKVEKAEEAKDAKLYTPHFFFVPYRLKTFLLYL
jgi:hypothetical protein